jgi:hypothetical protein
VINASAPLARVVDEILRLSDTIDRKPSATDRAGSAPSLINSSDTVRSCPRNATMAAFVRS